MRVMITSATVIDGSGASARPDSSIEIEDYAIVAVHDRPAITYDRSDVVIDARGAVVLPGIVNHHAHGLTRGPLMISGEPGLTDARVLANLRRQLGGGTTTALNVDGFPTTEDAAAVNKLQPVNVKVATLHTPKHLHWAEAGPFPMGGIADRHRSDIASMVRGGAVAVGEAGPGIDGHWADHTLIPLATHQALGVLIDAYEARRLRIATESRSRDELLAAFTDVLGVGVEFLRTWRTIIERVDEFGRLASEALDEAIDTAAATGLPLVFHHTPATFPRVVEAADRLGQQVIAAHSNFLCTSVDDTVRRARELRARGAYIDIMGGDSFGVKMFHPTPTHAFALIEAGLCDAISTDYCGGYWDSLLKVAVEMSRAGACSLESAVRMVTSTPATMVPGLAPQRGLLTPGHVADVIVTHPDDPAVVRSVLVSGHPVAMTDIAITDFPASQHAGLCC